MTPVLDPASDPDTLVEVSDLTPLPRFVDAAEAVLAPLRASSGLSTCMATRVAGDEWVVLSVVDAAYGLRAGQVLTWPDGLCSRMVRGHGPRVAPVVHAVRSYAAAPVLVSHRVGAYVGVPLVGPDGELFGTVCAFDPEPASDDLWSVLPLFEVQARLLSGLLAGEVVGTRAARSRELVRLRCAERLLGRRAWDDLLRHEEQRCAPLASPASVVALDVPGLPPGRRDLVARVLLDRRRPADAVARTGRSSYAVLLPETPVAAAEVVASRLVLRLQEVGVTATCGVAGRSTSAPLPRAGEAAEAVRRADAGEAA